MSDPDLPDPGADPAGAPDPATAATAGIAALRDPATWAEPPADLLARVEAALPGGDAATGGEVGVGASTAARVNARPPAPVSGEVGAPDARSTPARWRRTLLTAAAAVALVALGVVAGRLGDGTQPTAEGQTVGTFALVATAPASELSAGGPVIDRGVGFVYRLAESSLPPAADDDYYEGWVESPAGERVSIGTFHLRGDGTVSLWSGVDVAAYPIVVITNRAGDELLRGTVTLSP